ncbi:MAG: hypothetical protein IGR92_07265 [Leptolyngbyaceae cyanobacterium T60_A2020_046]|nr:hypothetical protein [Leptolyngbyaceae cyanobacterium T60_A2020_046]
MDASQLRNQVGFVVKVLGFSWLLAIALKAIGPRLPLPATTATCLILVLTPSLGLALFLGWRLRHRPTD